MYMSAQSKNTYTPAILIVTFTITILLVIILLVVANRQNLVLGDSDSASPTPTPVELNTNTTVQTLPPIQKIPLEEENVRQSGEIILDPELEIEPSSSPSVLQDKNINLKLPKKLP